MIQSGAAEIVAAYLCSVSSLGIGRPTANPAPAWPISVGPMPDIPDSCLAVRDLVPMTEGKIQRTGLTVQKPKVQILARARDYSAVELQLRKVAFALSPVERVTVTTLSGERVLFEACKVDQPGAFLFQEEKNRRQVFVCVVRLTISEIL